MGIVVFVLVVVAVLIVVVAAVRRPSRVIETDGPRRRVPGVGTGEAAGPDVNLRRLDGGGW